jgi:precorrin-6A/cobalt-precorrin-6A reductase
MSNRCRLPSVWRDVDKLLIVRRNVYDGISSRAERTNVRILILGGTGEARALARLVAQRSDLDAILSFAGRAKIPDAWPVPTRIGGFGGIDGLGAFLRNEAIDAVIDATHPFAAQMSAHAQAACRETGTPLVVLTRPAWQPARQDRWIDVADLEEAAAALGSAPKRAFLTVGRLHVAAFEAAPQHHYLMRSIEAPEPLPKLPHLIFIAARGPFDVAAERALMRDEKIDVLVTKNSGAPATYAKILAARELRLPVVMIARPKAPDVPALYDPAQALAWIDKVRAHASADGQE